MLPSFLADFDAESAAFGLKQTLPALAKLGKPTLVADGFSSHVFLIADEVVLRVAKTRESTSQQLKEVRTLPLLQTKLSLQIPQPQWYLEPSTYFPFGAVAYPIVKGRPFDLSLADRVDLEGIATSLARFLLELQNIESPKDVPTRAEEPAILWQGLQTTLQNHMGAQFYGRAEAWWNTFKHHEPAKTKLVHGDLWGENILLNDSLSKVVGIIDFELLAKSDIAQDFAPQLYVSSTFFNSVVHRFKGLGGDLGSDFERRVHDWAILRELRGLHYALKYPESNELEEQLEKVKARLDRD